MLVIVIDSQTNKPVGFRKVNEAVPIPITKDALRPWVVKINNEDYAYYELFTIAIKEKGWHLRQITI